MNKVPGAIKVLIITNVLLFGITLIPGMEMTMKDLLGLFLPENPKFQYWQIITSMFMHGGFVHILLNMYGLWAFGSPLEIMWGKSKFLVFYFVAGIGAGVIYLLVNYFRFDSLYNELIASGFSSAQLQQILSSGEYDFTGTTEVVKDKILQFYDLYAFPAVGASGAIYGVLVAFGMSFPNAKLALIFFPVPIPAKFFIPILIGIDLFSGVTGFSIFGGNIGHFAHVGGALVGFLLVWYWKVSGAIRLPVQ